MSTSTYLLAPSSSRSDRPDAATFGSGAQARHHTTGLVGALNADWHRLSRTATTRPRIAAWGERVPALAGFTDLPGVVAAATRPGDREVLLGLLVLAGDGDQLAARTALQVMLGAAVRLARRTRKYAGGDLEESIARAIAATWQVIRCYPVDRACRPADGISLDVLAALTGGRRDPGTEVPAGLASEIGEPGDPAVDLSELREAFWLAARLPDAGGCADEELILLLAWAVRVGAVSRSEARLLYRVHSPEEPGRALSCRDVADALGVGHAAVRQRVSRATRRLAAAVQSVVDSADLDQFAA